MSASVLKQDPNIYKGYISTVSDTRSKHIKGSKERLFIRTQTRNLQIFGVFPLVKLQNDAKMMLQQLNDEK